MGYKSHKKYKKIIYPEADLFQLSANGRFHKVHVRLPHLKDDQDVEHTRPGILLCLRVEYLQSERAEMRTSGRKCSHQIKEIQF